MKPNNYLLLTTFSICSILGFSQTTNSLKTTNKVLDSASFNRMLNQQFTQVLTGQQLSTVGSFATLDLTDTKVKIALSSTMKNGNVLGFKFSGGVSDGLSSLIKDSEFNTAFTIESQYHFFPKKRKRSIILNDTELREWNMKIKKVKREHKATLARISYTDTLALLEAAKLGQIEKKKNLEVEREKLKSAPASETLTRSLIRVKEMQIERLNGKIEAVQKTIGEIKSQEPLNWENEQRLRINNVAFAALEKLENFKSKSNKPTVHGFDIQWWSLGVKYGFDDFKLLDRSQGVSEQLIDTSGHNLSLSVQYSKYRWHTALDSTFLFTIRGEIGLRNTSSDLDKREIRDRNSIGTSGNLNREIESQYTAYEGDYEIWVPELSLRPDFYWFLPKRDPASNLALAIHSYGDLKFSKVSAPRYKAGGGFLFSFLKREGQKSNVNVEVFYEFSDISNARDLDLSLWESNQFGLNFIVPFYIVNSN
jgi:hypothetical protein